MATIEHRESAAGTISYRVKIRLKGFPVQSASFDRLTDAKKWVQSTESAIREGRYFKTVEAKRHTLADAIDRYITDVLPAKPKNQRSQLRQLEWWKTKLGRYSLADVTPALISECRDELLKGFTPRCTRRSPATVVRYLAVISHVFTIAIREWYWIAESPLGKVRRPSEPKGRVRFLSDDERAHLLVACKQSKSSHLYLIVVLAISTGMRRGEILSLRWSQVDLNKRRITLHETKNGERRAIPLHGLAFELVRDLSKIRRIDSTLLFPGLNPLKQIDPKMR